jgi:hypothetical protein
MTFFVAHAAMETYGGEAAHPPNGLFSCKPTRSLQLLAISSLQRKLYCRYEAPYPYGVVVPRGRVVLSHDRAKHGCQHALGYALARKTAKSDRNF